uniref:Vta1/callose synthase N-terminal domain-containing protein n=1 Tax=Strigamia maritima TaxID=126957 RepID=T1JJW8_STRMM
MACSLPPVPPILKPIQHYLKTASEHESRDIIVAYWCRLYALQTGLKIDRKAKESLTLLTALMDWLEKFKKEMTSNEAIASEIVAQAHIENYALKLFTWADSEDRASRFNKNVVKAFYTAGMLFDVLEIFGEPSEEILQNKKYSKWKAAYIHNCLKSGEAPIPGPIGDSGEGFAYDTDEGATGWNQPPREPESGNTELEFQDDPNIPSTSGNFQPIQTGNLYIPSAGAHAPPTTPSEVPSTPPLNAQVLANYDNFKAPEPTGGALLSAEDFTLAQKYCKWAGSALQYEDATTAIDNLQKALKLLTTGQRL